MTEKPSQRACDAMNPYSPQQAQVGGLVPLGEIGIFGNGRQRERLPLRRIQLQGFESCGRRIGP